MNRFKQIYTRWQRFTHWGVTDDLSIEEAIKTRLLNIVLFIAVTLLFTLLLRSIIVQELGQTIVISFAFLFVCIIIAFNVTSRQMIARLAIVSFIAIIMALIIIFLYPSPWELEYIFLMIIFVNYIFFKGSLQIVTTIFVVLMFVTAHVAEPRLPMEYKFLIPLTPGLPTFLFVFFVIYSFITLTYYQSEIKKYQASQKDTIAALKQGNIKLKSVSEELERFIYIVSTDLKSRLLVVRKLIQNIRSKINANNYTDLSHSLDDTLSSAKKMHFWVNDILEFGNVNQVGQRLEVDIMLNETLVTVKNNLQGYIQNVDKKIRYAELPKLHLNELEVFIVFYNLIKMAFLTHPNNAILNLSYYQNSDFLCFQFIRTIETKQSSHQQEIDKTYDNLNYNLQLCELIIKGWSGKIYISENEEKSNYEIFIPISKVILNQEEKVLNA